MEFTFNGIKADVKKKLLQKSKWKKTLFLGTYERILDAVSYALEKNVYQAEFLYKESKYKIATKKESLLIQAIPLHYKAYRKKGARGTVLLSGNSDFNSTYQYPGFQVYLPKWTILTNSNKSAKVFLTEDFYYYTGTLGNLELTVVEGTPKEYTYVSSGDANETFTIYNENIENDEIEVFITDAQGNILYNVNIVNNLYFVYDTESYSCEVTTSVDQKSVNFKFGDGISSKKLNAGEYILVKYAETKGDEGDINTQDTITEFEDIIYDSEGNAVTLYLTNQEAITGGTDVEGLESIRQNANNLFFSGYRLASTDDWTTLLAGVGYVYKSTVWTISSVGGSSASAEQNQVFITAISSNGENLTTAQQTELTTSYINQKKSLTEAVSFQDFKKIYLKFVIVAKIQNNSTTIVDEIIKQTLEDAYGVLNTDFQKSVHESNFYATINAIENVVYHTTTIYNIEKDFSPLISNYTILPSYTSSQTAILEKQIYLLEDSIKLWIKRKIDDNWLSLLQIGYSSGTTIYGMNGYTISGGSIIYTSNQISWNVSSIINSLPSNLIPEESSTFDSDGTDWYSTENGDFDWNNSTTDATYTALGTVGDNTIYKENLIHPGITYTLTFRAKSITLTDKLTIFLSSTEGTEITNPELTTSYQDYEFECLAPDDDELSLIIKFGEDLTLGNDITIDNIILKEKLPSGSYGSRNPSSSENDGYIIYLEYKTKDGNGIQTNSVRIPGFNQISDLEKDDFVETNLTYV